MISSKNRQRKCNSGLHEYGTKTYKHFIKGFIESFTTETACIHCGKKLRKL